MPAENLLILGASARAAAFSALAAGLRPVCGDAFADVDLRQVCPATATKNYPAGLAEIAAASPPGPWLYTGALENQPALVSRINSTRVLWGNDAQALVRVRDPFAISRVLAVAGLPAPAVRRSAVGLPRDGSWLRKPIRSSGGAGIAPWTAAVAERSLDRATKSDGARHVFQQRIRGTPCAAIFLAAAGQSQLLGATEQLLTGESPDAAFQYAGSVGPLPLSTSTTARLRQMGEILAAEFQLQGLFGVDYIDDGAEIWPIEINPRYTASVEILERALGFSAIGLHVAACRDCRLPADATPSAPDGAMPAWRAKRIVYARRSATVTSALVDALLLAATGREPPIADIPSAGTELLPGQPILTLFGHGATRDAAIAQIDNAIAAWADRLPI